MQNHPSLNKPPVDNSHVRTGCEQFGTNVKSTRTAFPWFKQAIGRSGSVAIFATGRRIAQLTASEDCGQDAHSCSANSDFIIEAAVIAHETGMTPAQLANELTIRTRQRDYWQADRQALLQLLREAEELMPLGAKVRAKWFDRVGRVRAKAQQRSTDAGIEAMQFQPTEGGR